MPFVIVCYADGTTVPHRPDYTKFDCPFRLHSNGGELCLDKCVGPKCAAWNGQGCGLKGRA